MLEDAEGQVLGEHLLPVKIGGREESRTLPLIVRARFLSDMQYTDTPDEVLGLPLNQMERIKVSCRGALSMESIHMKYVQASTTSWECRSWRYHVMCKIP